MAKPVKIRAKLKNGIASVKALMPHPMETGSRKNAEGVVIAAHYIETVTCELGGKVVLTAQWGPSVSKNPYFAFKVPGAESGDTVKISWVDNLGESSSGETTLK
ncbi:MAG: thiosulfate oxidation carrier complex protein SoxZ [Halieaceae bacterium]|jgi:sulfur-oxidizing protein SoxZ|nr:thiosulfate oxidation carrier complex protein SoxZ [Halieaceae bacterium]